MTRGHPWSPLLRARSRAPRANFTRQFDSLFGREVIAKRLAGHISRAGPAEALMPEVSRGAPEKGPWWRQLRTCSAPPGGSPACLNVLVSRDKDRSG